MRLVADANVLVGRLLGKQGRTIVTAPGLELFVAAGAWTETLHELPKRVEAILRQGKLSREQVESLASGALALIDEVATLVNEEQYLPLQTEALRRIPADPDDWPTVAVALLLDAQIWSEDRDFFGCGVGVWTTQTLATHLASTSL